MYHQVWWVALSSLPWLLALLPKHFCKFLKVHESLIKNVIYTSKVSALSSRASPG
jgi:hypothetical protein